jgi:hypothetical protein
MLDSNFDVKPMTVAVGLGAILDFLPTAALAHPRPQDLFI